MIKIWMRRTTLGHFMQMFKGMQSDIGIEKLGIIMVRSSGSGQHTNKLDLTMTGPRITQYYTGQSTKYSDIYGGKQRK